MKLESLSEYKIKRIEVATFTPSLQLEKVFIALTMKQNKNIKGKDLKSLEILIN